MISTRSRLLASYHILDEHQAIEAEWKAHPIRATRKQGLQERKVDA